MPKRRHISASDRKRIAAVRLQGLAVASVYQGRLARLRRAELRRVLALCKQLDDPENVPLVLEQEIREDYLMGWWQKLWMTAGPPAARDTAQELRQAKAAAEDNIWLQALRAYATQRAGENIVSVTGTWKTALVNLTRTLLGDDLGIGVEKLTQRIFAGYTGALQEWQCRRIAQTEALIGMAEAGNLATQQLGVAFTKQWCTSGLPNVRESHQEVDGLEVDENEPFELPGGLLMYPHDTHLGADASEIINCACACIRRPKSDSVHNVDKEPSEHFNFVAKSVDDAKQFILDNIADKIDFDIKKDDLDNLNPILNYLADRLEYYRLPKFETFKKATTRNTDASVSRDGKQFSLSTFFLRNKDKVYERLEEFRKKHGYRYRAVANKNDLVRATIDHEFGHVIANKYYLQPGEIDIVFSKNRGSKLGYYSTTSLDEFWAECVAAYHGPLHKEMTDLELELVNNFFKRNGFKLKP